ncbi:MAG TPA: hypothetical protein VLR26_16795 [Frankiaceae bacterium]|nr:hypothetical protein [Frankiaceae bacterium]
MAASLGSPAAYLRVFEPLVAFSDEQREYFSRLRGEQDPPPDRRAAERAERVVAIAAAVRPTLELPDGPVLMEQVDGLTYVCPLQTRLRALVAAGEFRESLARPIADAFLPAALADEVESELDQLRRKSPDLKMHVVSCTYLVPLPWFVAFDPSDRVLVTGKGPRSLRYVTAMSGARRRVARALSVLRRQLPDAPTVAGLEQLGRWLEEFHPHSRVELDYGGLVELLDDDALRDDSSVADIATALAALTDGRGPEAMQAYEDVLARWRPLQSLETAS